MAVEDAPDLGNWRCPSCQAHGRHLTMCKAPSGRCVTCNEPIDEHHGVGTKTLQCRNRVTA